MGLSNDGFILKYGIRKVLEKLTVPHTVLNLLTNSGGLCHEGSKI